ncbi:MAG: Ppx/GppA phosphatase family protein [Flavobacteriales bacterium]|jgi:exopolyphosphatase / guanosine-5'-triphosphate,3'-diphosphate pyrophosphatase|nr:exopolyphosphatase [Flavobacteriaceae bacterium]MDO7603308.1 exopolyphosphatase [Flavobacteriaceae bacterium]MDO7616160.1 exopolyphosphatase [Flavobacteriaceae bacterium]MDO7703057.1 exopolyphosphatase [Flavobacteriaceae bacterium]|tara:strand:+ start:115 stop:1005 length:891 start_codon:yes stop_codon:yes gene_type:complete
MKVKKLAAIDIGSNAIRILISNVVQVEGEHAVFMKSEMIRVPIRLGEDSFTVGEISPKNIKRVVKAMKAFKLIMKINGVKNYMACATSALRESSNADELIAKVKKKAGIKIELIDGKKEAEIISYTTILANQGHNSNYLYVDVGGGSTEFSVLKNGKRIVSKSFKAGTVRMINYMVNDKVWLEIEKWIKMNTKGIEKIQLLGSGGNINKVFKLSNIKDGNPITYFNLKSFYQDLKKLSYEERILRYNLNLDRADVILPALEIYLKALKWSGATKVFVPKIGLSDGMIKMMYKKHNA